MRRFVALTVCLWAALAVVAQTQQGFVKTKGRMVNGQHVAGQGLPGATVTIQGRSAVAVKNANGSFSFPVSGKSFRVQGVQKKGYQLVDADATAKAYQLSVNPVFLLMETPEQQIQDQLDAERKLRRTLQQKLRQREDEIDAMQVTVEEKQRLLQQLYKEQENNEKLIAEMAKEYAQMDYDQMDSLNQRISDAILNGRLTEADSLLRSKGNMASRIAVIRKEQQAEAREEAELTRRQQNLEMSKTGTQKKLEDIAQDCYNYFNRFKLEDQHDSAAYYIELRAELDSTNEHWQHEAAQYLQNQKQFNRAEPYFKRTLNILRNTEPTDTFVYRHNLAMALINYANLHYTYSHWEEAESMYKEALRIFYSLAEDDSLTYYLHIVGTKSNLGSLYDRSNRFHESEKEYMEALDICKRLALSGSDGYLSRVATTQNNLATLYIATSRYQEGEQMLKEALEIRKQLAESHPDEYNDEIANICNNLGYVCYLTHDYPNAETYYKEALELRRQLAKENPQANEPELVQIISNLVDLYLFRHQYDDIEPLCIESLNISRRLSRLIPEIYLHEMAKSLRNLYELYVMKMRFAECDSLFSEMLDVYKRFTKKAPQEYDSDIALVLKLQSFNQISFERYADAERSAREVLAINPSQHWIVKNLAPALLFQGKYAEAEQLYRQYKSEMKRAFLHDLDQFAVIGVIPQGREVDVEKIKQLLNERRKPRKREKSSPL